MHVYLIMPTPYLNQYCDPSFPFSHSVPFAECQYTHVTVSNALSWGQHDKLCPCQVTIGGGHVTLPWDILFYNTLDLRGLPTCHLCLTVIEFNRCSVRVLRVLENSKKCVVISTCRPVPLTRPNHNNNNI